MADRQDTVSSIAGLISSKYISLININNQNLNEILVRIMVEVAKVKGMTGEERKAMVMDVFNYLVQTRVIDIDAIANTLFFNELPDIIDKLYAIYRGKLFVEDAFITIRDKLSNEFDVIYKEVVAKFDLSNITNADILEIVSFVVKMVNRYKYLDKTQKKNLIVNILYSVFDDYLNESNINFDKDTILNWVDIVIGIEDKFFKFKIRKLFSCCK